MKFRAAIFLFWIPALSHAGEVRGKIVIDQPLTRRNVTAPVGLYQRGTGVELKTDQNLDAISFEKSHVVVYLEGAPGGVSKTVPAASIEQTDRRFSPDLIVIPAGSTVSFPNFDPIFHNVFSLSKAKSFDLGNYPKGQSRTVTFPKPGIVAVYCHLHPNMAASIVVTPGAWGVKADADGTFSLKDVPPGRYTVVAWHKVAGAFRKTITVQDGQPSEVKFTLPYVEEKDTHELAHGSLAHHQP
jgi:plastocyanin